MKKNLKLRTEILDIALNLEDSLNLTLLTLLFIDQKDQKRRKAITNKSGNLSFINKINLMFDLKLLSKNEHQNILLLMIFRNQFLHNLECNSFKKAVELLGSDKGRKLLLFYKRNSNFDKEFRYQDAFRLLHLECLKIFQSKIHNRKKQLDKIHNTQIKQFEYSLFLMDSFTDILKKVLRVCEKNISPNLEVLKIVDLITTTISNENHQLFASKKGKKLSNYIGKDSRKYWELLTNKDIMSKE